MRRPRPTRHGRIMKGALFLPVYEKGFLNDNQELLPALLERRHGARLALAVCTNWRRAAIAVLLQSGRADQFHRRLQRSGSAFLHFIRGTPPSSTRLTDSAPFLDAIAAGDFATADDIARHSNHRWIEDEEYEEDFLFYEFLMTHALPGAPADPANAILDRWDACLAGTDDQRLPVCHAMVGKDAAAFDAALIDYPYDSRGAWARRHVGHRSRRLRLARHAGALRMVDARPLPWHVGRVAHAARGVSAALTSDGARSLARR